MAERKYYETDCTRLSRLLYTYTFASPSSPRACPTFFLPPPGESSYGARVVEEEKEIINSPRRYPAYVGRGEGIEEEGNFSLRRYMAGWYVRRSRGFRCEDAAGWVVAIWIRGAVSYGYEEIQKYIHFTCHQNWSKFFFKAYLPNTLFLLSYITWI